MNGRGAAPQAARYEVRVLVIPNERRTVPDHGLKGAALRAAFRIASRPAVKPGEKTTIACVLPYARPGLVQRNWTSDTNLP